MELLFISQLFGSGRCVQSRDSPCSQRWKADPSAGLADFTQHLCRWVTWPWSTTVTLTSFHGQHLGLNKSITSGAEVQTVSGNVAYSCKDLEESLEEAIALDLHEVNRTMYPGLSITAHSNCSSLAPTRFSPPSFWVH